MLLALTLLVSFSVSCAHLPKDIHPNPAQYGYHRMEFDTNNGKEIGIANFNLMEKQSLDGLYFTIRGVYNGTLYLKSRGCNIDMVVPYQFDKQFYLSELINEPTKCTINITAEVAPIKLPWRIQPRQHNMVESGQIKINITKEDRLPAKLIYYSSNYKNIGALFVSKKEFNGQGSIQIQEGGLSKEMMFQVETNSELGEYRVTGCEKTIEGKYNSKIFNVRYYDLYKKEYIMRKDSCDFEVVVLPYDEANSYYGRLSLNIYGSEIKKLEPMTVWIRPYFWWERIKAEAPRDYMFGCSINRVFLTKDHCSNRYYKDTTYYIRGFTTNLRKSIFGFRNGKIIWTE